MAAEWPEHMGSLHSFSSLSRFRKIGLGTFGSVYKANVAGKEQPVAVKVLTAEEENSVDLFTKEALLLKKLDHKNIVRFIGLVNVPRGAKGIPEAAHQKRLAILQEYLQGESLQSMIMRQMISSRNSVYDDEMALEIAKGIAEGLRFLQERHAPIVHRDITAANIMTTRDNGVIKACIIDFGISTETKPSLSSKRCQSVNIMKTCERNVSLHKPKSMPNILLSGGFKIPVGSDGSWVDETRDFQSVYYSHKLLKTDNIWVNNNDVDKKLVDLRRKKNEFKAHNNLTGQTGSFMYMAPEVYAKSYYDEKADIYSFGIVLYEVFARAVLLATETSMDSPQECFVFAEKVLDGYRPRIPASVPLGISDLIQRCWDQNQNNRPSIHEINNELRNIRLLEKHPVPVRKPICQCM